MVQFVNILFLGCASHHARLILCDLSGMLRLEEYELNK